MWSLCSGGSVREGTWPLHPTSTSLARAGASLPGKSWVVCLGYVHLGEDSKQVREPPLLPPLCFAAFPHSNCRRTDVFNPFTLRGSQDGGGGRPPKHCTQTVSKCACVWAGVPSSPQIFKGTRIPNR